MREKVCLECRKPLNGRRDKKFCDEGCRNTYHNRINSEKPLSVRSVNTILSKNRKIISQIMYMKGELEITEQKLSGMGFNFEYFTGLSNENNKIYHHCYEFAYVSENKGIYKVYQLPILEES